MSFFRSWLVGVVPLFLFGVSVSSFAQPPALDLSAPLGSVENPVRASMPVGERDYLMRSRCPEGDAPEFERRGSVGVGPYGNILDLYDLKCRSGRAFVVYMDMYHRHREVAPVPGLTELPEHPGRLAQECPPQVPGTEPGKYIFNVFEVTRPAKSPGFNGKVSGYPVSGGAFVRVVIGNDGIIAESDIEIVYSSDENVRNQAIAYLKGLRFEAAEHHPGCRVPMRVEFPLSFNAVEH